MKVVIIEYKWCRAVFRVALKCQDSAAGHFPPFFHEIFELANFYPFCALKGLEKKINITAKN